ncbi:hypothetical protein NU08_0657 [Flavobacterium anhuiense]|uniref:Uncharacterized protein n=1 Tax=Flavobacterium anhuiense TaxID=459526 RepID=A0A444W1W6_9FLAO|nr:hypothetical protein NU08_0657 [Flavobacterium anhuiense]
MVLSSFICKAIVYRNRIQKYLKYRLGEQVLLFENKLNLTKKGNP